MKFSIGDKAQNIFLDPSSKTPVFFKRNKLLLVISFPSKNILPLSGLTRLRMIFKVVVFPAPFGPRKATISPAFTLKETSETAFFLFFDMFLKYYLQTTKS